MLAEALKEDSHRGSHIEKDLHVVGICPRDRDILRSKESQRNVLRSKGECVEEGCIEEQGEPEGILTNAVLRLVFDPSSLSTFRSVHV